ncbi:MAG: FtsX-like permease family protein [Candidatus Hermodarchaeota archaeon]
MFSYIVLLACGLGLLYIIGKNARFILEKRKEIIAQQALTLRYLRSKVDLLRFGYRYAKRYLLTYRKRAATLLFGFIAATTIVTSTFMWIEVAPYDILQKSLENQAFSSIIQPKSASDSELIPLIQESLKNDSLVETSKIVRQRVALYGVGNKPDSFVWYSPEYIAGSVDFYIAQFNELFIMPDDYLSYIEKAFMVEGTFRVSRNEVVVSKHFARKLEARLDQEINVGSVIDIGIAQRFPDPSIGEITLGAWDMYRLRNVRIAGIYIRKPLDVLKGEQYSADTLGDGMFVGESAFPEQALERITANEQIISTQLFVRFNRGTLAERGISNLKETLQSFKFQIQESSSYRVNVNINTEYLYYQIEAFTNTKLFISSLLMPSFIASFLLIIFTTRLLYPIRKEEIKTLGAKGASTFQIFYGLIMELLILALIGSILGIIASIGNMFFIGGTNAFMEVGFNWALLWDILRILLLKPAVWIIPPIICSAVLIFSVSHQINNYLKLEDAKRQEPKKKFQKWITDNYLDVTALVGSYLILVFTTAAGIVDFILIDTTWLAVLLVLVLGIWIGLTLISTKVQIVLGRPATYLLKPILKNHSIFVRKNFQRRQTQILALGAILIFAGSISLFSLSYPAVIQNHNQKIVNFTVGADLRIKTETMDPMELFEHLSTIPEITEATPVFETRGFLGERSVSILGVAPLAFSTVTIEKIPDSYIQQQWSAALNRLNNRTNGAIINSLIAQRYNLTIGDSMTLTIRQEYQQEFIIVGHFSAAPGFGALSQDPETYTGNDYGKIFVSACCSIRDFQNINLALCKVEPGTDLNRIIYQLYDQTPKILYITTPNVDVKGIEFLSLTGTAGILSFNFIIAGLIFFLGLILFFNHVIDQRSAEYAVMRVCGARTSDLSKMISSEGLLVIGISFTTSTILGLTFAWIFSKISLKYVPSFNVLPLTFEFPLYSLVPLIFVIGAIIFLGTLYTARRVKEQSIIRIIKNL